jgi:hypothetical protein
MCCLFFLVIYLESLVMFKILHTLSISMFVLVGDGSNRSHFQISLTFFLILYIQS